MASAAEQKAAGWCRWALGSAGPRGHLSPRAFCSCGSPEPAPAMGAYRGMDTTAGWGCAGGSRVSGAALPAKNQLLCIPVGISALALPAQALLLQFLSSSRLERRSLLTRNGNAGSSGLYYICKQPAGARRPTGIMGKRNRSWKASSLACRRN